MSDYWQLFVNEVPSDLGIKMDEQQKKDFLYALEGAMDNEGAATGREVWDANWKADNDKNLKLSVVKIVEDICRDMDGNSRIFDVATENQKEALAKLFNFKKYLLKERLI